MGYSSSSTTLLRAISAKHVPDTTVPRNAPINEFHHVTLSAHLNPFNEPGEGNYHRLGVLHTVDGGIDGEGKYIPARSSDFFPTFNGNPGKILFTAVSQTLGGFLDPNAYHFWTTQVAWIRFGTTNPTVATTNCYPVMPYTVYPIFPATNDPIYTAATVTTYMGIIRDTVDGYIYIARTGERP